MLALALALVAVSLVAEAQYTFIDLTHNAFGGSAALGVSDGQQVGAETTAWGGNARALLWSGTAASLVDLNPSGFDTSVGFGISGGQRRGPAELPSVAIHKFRGARH